MAPYEYSALDESASEIRLMTLLPGRFEDDISITIETVVLTKEHIPQYEALSYVWGSKENLVGISAKALVRRRRRRPKACSHGTISVTQNLAIALPYLRKEDKPRVLWIDAICVNQQDRAERGHQVKRMAAVYSMASQVIIWLGPESQNSTLALRAIDHVGSQLQVDWFSRKITLDSTGETIAPIIDPFNSETWKSVGALLRRPWFERLWIWQEARLAREAYLFCGNEGVPWESVRRAILYLQQAPKQEYTFYAINRCCIMVNHPSNVADALDGLGHALGKARSASCSDPRDKIFAILSLAHKYETRGLDPDYSKPAEAVFQELVLHFFQCTVTRHSNPLRTTGWVRHRRG